MPVELSVRDVGSGLPVVLLHAFPLSSSMWLAQREHLSGACRVITPDQRGFGGSPLGEDPPALARAAEDVIALLDRLELESVVLGGLSMGGYVAMELMRQAPERVQALVLADTKAGADPEGAQANRRRIADEVLADGTGVLLRDVYPALLGPSTTQGREAVATKVRSQVEAAPPAAVAWAQRAMADRPDSLETLRGVTVPTLVVVGDEDVLSPVSEAELMAQALPHGELVVLSGSGHLTAVEVPDSFNLALSRFLTAL